MKKTTLILFAVVGIFATMFSACRKASPAHSTITYVNDAYTPMTVIINGYNQTIPAGGSATYTGDVSSEANGTATTSGTFGLTVSLTIADNYPDLSGDNVTYSLDIPAEYFYLKAVNTYTSPTSSIIVNLGLTSQTNEPVSVANDGNTYGIGYYYGFSNTVIKATYTDNTTLTISNLSIPNTLNASYTAQL